MPSTLRIERITTPAGLDALKDEWQALFARAGSGLPFHTWEWHAAWWSHMTEASPWVSDELFVCALRTPQGELKAVAPLMLTRRPAKGPFGFRALDFIGPDPNITELRGMFADPAWETRAYAALRTYLAGCASEWDWIHWRGLREGTPAHAQLMNLPGSQAHHTTDNWLLPLPATWEQLKSSRPRNLKESLRKCYNSLKRDGHTFTLRVASSPQEVAAAVERFFALHGARAKADVAVTHKDVFAAPQARDFLDDICQRYALKGACRVFELIIKDEVVATRIGFLCGDSLYLYYSGYLPEWGDYSVMTTCVAEAIQYAIAQGWKTVNLSTGTDVSKTRWAPDNVRYGELVEVASSLGRRYAYPAYQEVRKMMAQPKLKAVLGRRARK